MGQDIDEAAGVASAASPLAAVTISCSLGERRQMQMSINISCADPVEVQNAMLDNAMQRMDRQQARYDLEKLEENFQLVGLNTRNAILALNSADIAQKSQVERLKAELEGKREARVEVFNKAYGEHTAGNRKGEFVPKGFVRANLSRMDADIQKTVDAIEAAPKDAEQEKGKIVGSIQRNQEDLRQRRKQINDLRHLAGLEPTTEFEDAESAKV